MGQENEVLLKKIQQTMKRETKLEQIVKVLFSVCDPIKFLLIEISLDGADISMMRHGS
jgi:hypothetical protein